jgi:hypothetical protein
MKQANLFLCRRLHALSACSHGQCIQDLKNWLFTVIEKAHIDFADAVYNFSKSSLWVMVLYLIRPVIWKSQE